MTKENVKRLLEHYKNIGYTKAYDNLLEKYPNLAVEAHRSPVMHEKGLSNTKPNKSKKSTSTGLETPVEAITKENK